MPQRHSLPEPSATSGAPLATRLYVQGDVLAQQGRYRDALVCFDQALQIVPDHGDAWVFRAVALIYLECHEDALESCNRALELDSTHTEAWLFRGVALHRQGRYQEAYMSYDRALGVRRRSQLQRLIHWSSRIWSGLWLQRLLRLPYP